MNKVRIIGIVVVIVAIGGLIWLFSFRDGSSGGPLGGSQASQLDAIDTVINFYGDWLDAVKNPTSADPSRKDLVSSPLLSKALSDRLSRPEQTTTTGPDPVLCQTRIPENISTTRVYEDADSAQVLVKSRDKKATEQALVTLVKQSDGWRIATIECSAGEFAPEKEFSFEMEGYLLKGSIPAPFNKSNWHLVFEENGKLGNVVPLFFDAKTQCTDLNGAKLVCADQLKETTKVFIQGQMTERGVTVKFSKLR